MLDIGGRGLRHLFLFLNHFDCDFPEGLLYIHIVLGRSLNKQHVSAFLAILPPIVSSHTPAPVLQVQLVAQYQIRETLTVFGVGLVDELVFPLGEVMETLLLSDVIN